MVRPPPTSPLFPYTTLFRSVNQLAHLLRAAGVGPGHIVALLVERSFAMIVGIMGILKAGGAYLPISPDNPPDRIDRKSTRLNSSHVSISYAVFCLKKKN